MQGLISNEGSTVANGRSAEGLTRALLSCGAIAGPLYIVVGTIQVLTRQGFDVRFNILSQMSLGDLGWIQVANFAVSGLLVLACAIGLRRVLHSRLGGTWGPRLVGVYGLGLIAAALFNADPGFGFPPGTPVGPPTTMSTHGLLHFASAVVGFFALIGACFVFARRFAKLQQRGWAVCSLLTGTFFLAAFLATASGSGLPVFTLALWVAIFLAWLWLSIVAARLMAETRLASVR